MKKRTKKMLVLLAVSCLTSCFLFTSLSFSQEMPKPGEVIDKTNYKKYAHLFPEEGWLGGFENGWEGLFKPLSLKVTETKLSGPPKAFLKISEKNRGKFSLDKDQFIVGGYDYNGLPFPGVTKDDKDFGYKVMWNYAYRYVGDDLIAPYTLFRKRRGESIFALEGTQYYLQFINRLHDKPNPIYTTPPNLQTAMLLHDVYPLTDKDMMYLSYRYLDARKSDDMYIYIPTMRRVLRADAGQRSTPIAGAPQAPDDFDGFDGKTFEFDYKYVGEQKILGCTESMVSCALSKKMYKEIGGVPFPNDNWSVRDAYVIDVISKNPKYPQSKKRIYMDKECGVILYSLAWDRAGKFWKLFALTYSRSQLPDNDTNLDMNVTISFDFQFGMGQTYFIERWKIFGNGLKYVEFMPTALLKRVK